MHQLEIAQLSLYRMRLWIAIIWVSATCSEFIRPSGTLTLLCMHIVHQCELRHGHFAREADAECCVVQSLGISPMDHNFAIIRGKKEFSFRQYKGTTRDDVICTKASGQVVFGVSFLP